VSRVGIEEMLQMSRHACTLGQACRRKRDSLEAHLTIALVVLAVSHWIETGERLEH
jgi:hypothetical protein